MVKWKEYLELTGVTTVEGEAEAIVELKKNADSYVTDETDHPVVYWLAEHINNWKSRD